MAFEYVVFDVEANGFKPTELFCICMTDLISGESCSFIGDDIADACVILSEAKMIVGHYIRGYDCPVIEKLTDGMIKFDQDRVVDTLEMSKRLTNFKKHGLLSWGPIVGLDKMTQPLFEVYTPEMVTYCERDVAVNVKVFYNLLERYLEANREIKFRNCELVETFFAEMRLITDASSAMRLMELYRRSYGIPYRL